MSGAVIAAIWRDHKRIFERISTKKLADYDQTQTRLRMTNVVTDSGYQRVYKSFYVMGRRSVAWYEFYFGLLEREKRNQSLTFESVLRAIFIKTARVEPSFSSKLVAAVRPKLPVYDEMARFKFDRRFPDFTHFTDTKKLDIMLWQWRNAETNSDRTE